MNNSMNFGEIICESVDTIVLERLKSINFDATITCTIVDDSQREQGTYVVTDGSTRFTAYTSDTKLKNNQQVYVTIPSNDYSEQKIIVGKKTVENSNEPYIYNPPFNNFIKGSNNLVINTSDDYFGLTANSHHKYSPDIKKQPVTILTIPVTNKLPVTEIPFTRIGLKANFKTLLPSNTTQGNYGLRIVPKTNNNESEPAALDCEDFYGNPYQFFNYINQEQVFVIPPTWGPITEITLQFFQDNNFNLDLPEQIDEDLSWIEDSIGQSAISNVNNIFVSGIELYLGYDINDFNENNFQIYSADNVYAYNNIDGVRTEKVLKGEWVFVGEDNENSEIISADILPYDKEAYNPLKKNILLSNGKYINMYCWKKNEDSMGRLIYQGVQWYRQKYGAPKPDDYAGGGWEILDPNDIDNELYSFISPLELKIFLRTNNAEENYKCIIFDNLIFTQQEIENKENLENIEVYEDIEQIERPLQINNCTPIVSNTINFINNNYEKTISLNKQTQLSIITTDKEDGNYYYYNLLGKIENDNWSRELRTLNLYYENSILDQNSKCKVEWIVPIMHSMFQDRGFKILGLNLDEINSSDKKKWIKVENLNQQKNPTISNNTTYYKRITIDNLNGEALGELNNPFALDYQISQTYNQTKINNNIDCKLYYLNDEIPYTTSRKFNFGMNSTSGTEVVVSLQCEELKWGTKNEVIGYHPIIKLDQGNQLFRITPRLVISNTQQIISPSDFQISYEWYGRNNIPPESFTHIEIENDEVKLYIDKDKKIPINDEYIVLQMSMDYGEYQNLTTYLPFAFAGKVDDINYAEIPEGPFQVIYDSASGLPFEDYHIPYGIDNIDSSKLKWQIYLSENNIWIDVSTLEEKHYYPAINNLTKNLNTLIPSSFYTEGLKPVSVRALGNNQIYWSQPLLILKNKFPNTLINKWDNNLLIDEENNTIMATMLVAGSKNEENKFSGVIMGKPQGASDSSLDQYGLFGYNNGEQSYAFKEDGTAFIGKNGKGRIEFDGNQATIKSSNYDMDQGIEIDLDNNYFISRANEKITDNLDDIKNILRLMAQYQLGYTVNHMSTTIQKLHEICGTSGNSITVELVQSATYQLLEQKAHKEIEALKKYYLTLETQEKDWQYCESYESKENYENIEKSQFNFNFQDNYGLDLQIKLSGELNELNPQAFTIGLVDNPSFQVDWKGNTTIVGGNFTIKDKEGSIIFEVGEQGLTFNALNQLNDTVQGQQNIIDGLKDEIAQGINNNEQIKTPKGYQFSDNGLIISSTNNLYTVITEDGMTINQIINSETIAPVLTVNSEGVSAKDLRASTYLVLGENSRFENFSRGSEQRTGCFWIGG